MSSWKKVGVNIGFYVVHFTRDTYLENKTSFVRVKMLYLIKYIVAGSRLAVHKTCEYIAHDTKKIILLLGVYDNMKVVCWRIPIKIIRNYCIRLSPMLSG